jgi:uncharacterized lipoprotein YmbA
MIRTCLVVVLASAPLVAGCSALSPQADKTRYFVLSPVAVAAPAPSIPFDHTVGIGPLSIPDHLETQIVTRLADEEMAISDTERWGESLRDSLGPVMRQNLVVLLGTERIVMYPWALASPPDLSVSVDVLRFERTTKGTVELAARWSVARGPDRAPMWIREASVTKPVRGSDTRAAVAALSAALYDLSWQIAADIRQIPVAPSPQAMPERLPGD